MIAEQTPARQLKASLSRTVTLAARCEQQLPKSHQRKPLQMVCYGMLVRLRRLARAVRRLDVEGAYEARIIIRSMIELHFNYSWIRLRHSDSRARRFLRFDALEKLRIIEELPPDMLPERAPDVLKALRAQRAAVRHLFQTRDREGRLRWAKHWATHHSFEARLQEVRQAHQLDSFLYALYRWTSGTAHGNPLSLNEVLERTEFGARPKQQPEPNPTAALVAANVVLLATLSHAAADLDLSGELRRQIGLASARFRQLPEVRGKQVAVNGA